MGWSCPAHQQFFPFIGGGVHDSVLMIVPPTPCKLFHLSLSVLQGTYFLSFCSPSWKIGADQPILIDESDEVGDLSETDSGFHSTYGPGTIPFMGRTTDAGFFVPHLSIPPNNSMLPLTFIFGSSISIFGANAVKMKTHSFILSAIFGDDDSGMACCIPPAPLSLNVACQDPIPLPFDLAISPCSVEVGVTLADVWAALIDYAMEIGFELGGAALEHAFGGLKKGAKKLFSGSSEVVEDAGQKAAKEALEESLSSGKGWKKKLPFADWGQAKLANPKVYKEATQAAEGAAAEAAAKEAAGKSAKGLSEEAAESATKAGRKADEAADAATKADDAAKKADDAAQGAKQSADEAENARKAADKQVDGAKKQTGRAQNQADEAKRQADRAGRQADQAGEQADQAAKQADEAGQQADQAAKRADEAGEQADQAAKRADEAGEQADQAGRRAQDAADQADQAKRQADELRQQADEMKRNAQDFRRQADEANANAAESGEFGDRLGAGELELDAQNLRQRAGELNGQAKQAEEAANALDGQARQADQAARQADQAKRQADELKRQADEAKRQADEAKRQVDEAKRQVDEAKRQADEAKRQADQAKRQADEATESAQKRADEAQQDLAKKQKQLDDAKRAEADAGKQADQAKKDADKAKKKHEDALKKSDEAKQAFDEAEAFKEMTPEEKARKILQDARDDYYARSWYGRLLPADEFDFIPIGIGNLAGRAGGEIVENAWIDDTGEDLLEMSTDEAEHPSVQLTTEDAVLVGSQLVTDRNPVVVRVRFSKTVRGFGLKHVRTSGAIASNLRVVAKQLAEDDDESLVEHIGGLLNPPSPYAAQVFELDVSPQVEQGECFTVDVDAAQVSHEDEWGLLYPNKAAHQLRVRFENRGPVPVLTAPIGEATNESKIPFTASFNLPVTGFEKKDVQVSNANIAEFTALSDREYRFDVRTKKEGPVEVKIPAGVAKGPFQRDNLASAVFEFEYDKSAPQVSADVPVSGTTARAQVPVRAEFDKPVQSFGPEKIQVENARITSFEEITPGRSYAYVIEPQAPGPVSAKVPAGAVPDLAGNPNPESVVEFVFDNSNPGELLASDFPGLPPEAVARIQAGLEIIAGTV